MACRLSSSTYFFFSFICLETEFHCAAQAGLELAPQTYKDPPASAFGVLRLKMCDTIHGYFT